MTDTFNLSIQPINFEAHLACYAARSAHSRGRRYTEPGPSTRTEFQRDRDRIIHSTAFRRLEYKTQVFVNHEGDLFRTRLTHSLEVAQIARAIARCLRANEDLVEAISLAHDLGHTPFGHIGQEVLNKCMREDGGFEHNFHSLEIVDVLEERYGDFNGLNLCFETREGILKHCSHERAQHLGDVGERFISRAQPTLEAQIANFADEIAYNNHDVDDGLRSGLLTLKQLSEVALWHTHYCEVIRVYPTLRGLRGRRLIYETIRRMINALIIDLITTTAANLTQYAPDSPDAVRNAPPLVAYSTMMVEQAMQLKRFLFQHLYRHYRVARMANKARLVVTKLFDAFKHDPQLLPPAYQTADPNEQRQRIAYYIAGMTDRYALKEYRRLFVFDED